MLLRWARNRTVALVTVATLLGSAPLGVPQLAAAAEPVRILAVGDSITQGTDGDRTWRWFAWREWRRQGVAVDMVGPRRAPHTFPEQKVASRYVDPDFDSDHAGIWGARIAVGPLHDATTLVNTHRPDVVVLELGTNDLAWGAVAPETVLAAVEAWVAAARAARPGVDVVLVEVFAPDTAATRAHNTGLHRLAARLDTSSARVTVARTTVGMRPATSSTSGGDTYDPLHPNARGEAIFAAAVVDAVAGAGVGRAHVRPVPLVPEGPRTRVAVRTVSGGPRAINVRWTLPPGATGSDVWVRRPGKAWKRKVSNTYYDAGTVSGLTNCRTYQVKVGTRRGWTKADPTRHSTPRTVVAGGKVRAVVEVRGSRASGGRATVRWAADGSACSYRVRATLHRTDGTVVVRTVTTRKPRASLRGLKGAGRLTVRVRAVGKKGAGPRSSAVWLV